MALYKRPGSKYWWLDFEFESRRHQLSTKCSNKRDAEKYAAAYKTQLANDKVDLKGRKAVASLDDAIDDFLHWSRLQQIDSTHRRYVTSSKALIQYFSSRKVNEIDRAQIEKFVAWRSQQKKKAPPRRLAKNRNAKTRKGIRPATINRELALLRVVFNRLVDQDVIAKNPVARFKFLPEKNEEIRILDSSEIKIYLIACSQPLRDVANLMLETGMRPSEIYGLKKSDLNFKSGFIQVSAGKTKSARRKIPMSSIAREILSARFSKPGSSFVFAGGKDGTSDKPIVKLTNAHNAAVTRSKLEPFKLYALRHTFATRACEAGIDLVTVKDILGHSRLEMVLRYSHPTEAHRTEAMRTLEEYRKTA